MIIADLVSYNHAVREMYLDSLAKLPWAEVVKPRALSFDSARNVFLHLAVVEDRWVNYILPHRFGDWKDPNFDSYMDIESLKRYAEATKKSAGVLLQSLKSGGWTKKVTLPWGSFEPYTRVTVETALAHMVLEGMIHYGELSAMLWQMNLDAPYLGYCRSKLAQDARR
jgi:uncharacterized damage-inducible protein DinB